MKHGVIAITIAFLALPAAQQIRGGDLTPTSGIADREWTLY
jgi:hypothetical protein